MIEIPNPDLTFNPGPSEFMPNVEQYMAEGVRLSRLSHRSDMFQEVFKYTTDQLRRLLDVPAEYAITFTSSATNAMAVTVRNLIQDSSEHYVNGAFSERAYKEAEAANKRAVMVPKEWGEGFRFSSDKTERFEEADLTFVTQNETSTGVMIPVDDIRKLKEVSEDSLLAVDSTSCAPYGVDVGYSDVTFFSVQKGFGMPPGLGVMILSPDALAKSASLRSEGFDVGGYQAMVTAAEKALKNQTVETPNMAAIYTLGRVANDMFYRDPFVLEEELDDRADVLYELFDIDERFSPLVTDEEVRSPTVLAINTRSSAQELIRKLLKKHNVVIGEAYRDQDKDRQIRIGNFPAHTQENVDQLISLLDKEAK